MAAFPPLDDMRILNLEPDGYSADALKILQSHGDVVYGPLTRDDLLLALPSIDILVVRLGHQIDRKAIEAGKSLKAIVTATTGLNHIDIDAATERNIAVLSLKGEQEFLKTVHATAEHTMALMLALMRRLPFAHQSVMDGQWNRDLFKGGELEGKTLGILGLGRLGSKVAHYAKAFGMRVIAYDTDPSCVFDGVETVNSAADLARTSDIVSVHIPSNKHNRHFVNVHFLSAMRPGSRIINTARGDVLDQAALISALQSGHLSGAALDVLEEEYQGSMGTSALVEYARGHHNVIITPHIGGATQESMHKTEIFMARKLDAFLKGCA